MLPFCSDEQLLAQHLNNTHTSARTWHADGGRHTSWDLRLGDIQPAFFEVKRLSLSGRSVDRRFKIGGPRSARLHGRTRSLFGRAALNIEEWLDGEERAGFIDGTLARTLELCSAMHHELCGVGNRSDFLELCGRLSGVVEGCREAASSSISGADIAEAFQDLEGIFFVVSRPKKGGASGGPDLYLFAPKNRLPELLEFHSVSAEGVKLRYKGKLPAYD